MREARNIFGRWLLAMSAVLVSVFTVAGLSTQLPAGPLAEVSFSGKTREAAADSPFSDRSAEAQPGGRCEESRLARLWEEVASHPESAIALASLGNEYARTGETKLALQSFQLALDQLSTDPDLGGAARARFRYAVERRIRFLRHPGIHFARRGDAPGKEGTKTED